ncbi:hypothetical protein Droror1_Dr00023401, partial [Drosera rotundifolia]
MFAKEAEELFKPIHAELHTKFHGPSNTGPILLHSAGQPHCCNGPGRRVKAGELLPLGQAGELPPWGPAGELLLLCQIGELPPWGLTGELSYQAATA